MPSDRGSKLPRGIVNLLSGLSSARLMCHTRRMNPSSINRYKHHRFPVEIISHAVWLYFRFCLSYRDVEELLFARGVIVTYEAIRKWCRTFGQGYANQLRRRRPQPGDTWHLEMCQTQPIKISWCPPLRLFE
jgi:transposase-like protein